MTVEWVADHAAKALIGAGGVLAAAAEIASPDGLNLVLPVVVALMSGGAASLVTAWAARRKLGAERDSIIVESAKRAIEAQSEVIEGLRAEVTSLRTQVTELRAADATRSAHLVLLERHHEQLESVVISLGGTVPPMPTHEEHHA